MNRLRVNLIVAFDEDYGIGKDGSIPWKCDQDLERFRELTTGGIVIMGRKTYESIGRPLPKRVNMIISSTIDKTSLNESIHVYDSLNAAFNDIKNGPLYKDTIWIMGGSELYKEAMPYAQLIYTTQLRGRYDCDTFFDPVIIHNTVTKEIENEEMKDGEATLGWYVKYRRQNEFDDTYLSLANRVLHEGVLENNRTDTSALVCIGTMSRYNLSLGIPILTTKHISMKNVIEELLWMLRGSTNSKELADKGVHIWDANTTREFLDSRGLDYEDGEIGPGYGFQMRYCGANYPSREGGIDQIANIIHLLKNDPTNRRIIMNLWNVADIDKMALPPCHMNYQFNVVGGKLSCVMYQRSGDIGLGVPYNIAASSILTYILANICDLEVGELVHMIGNAHIYSNHVDALKSQAQNPVHGYPQLHINRKLTNVDDLQYDDFEIIGYTAGPRIKMEMAV